MAADSMAAGSMADIGVVHGGRRGAFMAQRYTTVPMRRITTGIRTTMDIRIMRTRQRPHMEMLRPHHHLRPSVTPQWLIKMAG